MEDHHEIDRGVAALVSDRGYRHHRNEDAGEVVVDGDRVAVVVCDGVSSTANPDQASAAAAEAAMDVLRELLASEPDGDATKAAAALRQAVIAARRAVDDVPEDEPGGYPGRPSTTMVVALVAPGWVITASVGDSRGYWLPDRGANRRLTVDDSWAEAAIAAGVPEPAAYAAPQSHVITNWIGGDATDDDPAVATANLEVEGLVVVCSDGLWNYLPGPDDLAAAVPEGDEHGPEVSRPLAVARSLVAVALDAGGSDNITVAVVAAGPAPS
ncbi:MAG: protein phosphatase 2C domain-containing protein [Actinomycetota bacterium]|nr:protein phosphatase 2C domain-containing protein [Actinomycetota bacterium]